MKQAMKESDLMKRKKSITINDAIDVDEDTAKKRVESDPALLTQISVKDINVFESPHNKMKTSFQNIV